MQKHELVGRGLSVAGGLRRLATKAAGCGRRTVVAQSSHGGSGCGRGAAGGSSTYGEGAVGAQLDGQRLTGRSSGCELRREREEGSGRRYGAHTSVSWREEKREKSWILRVRFD